MTIEEAKELLLNISAYDIDMQRGMAKQEAIEMAIKALEQINKIADIVDGTIDHFKYDDAMDTLYEIKGVIK